MTSFRAVVFDLDGTLVDHRGASLDAVDAFVASRGVEPTGEIRAVWAQAEHEQFEQWRAGRISFAEQRRRRMRMVLPTLGLAIPEGDEALDDLFELYLVTYRNAWRAFPDAAPVVTGLRRRAVRIGVLTNGTEEQQRDKLARSGLAGLVDVVCTSERIGAAKPDARAFRTVADELGVRPRDCLFVGDDPEHDIAGATAAGMVALQVAPGLPGGPGLRAVLDLVDRSSQV